MPIGSHAIPGLRELHLCSERWHDDCDKTVQKMAAQPAATDEQRAGKHTQCSHHDASI
jgi:hypothetical protein